jgi:pimeloyl-ACP methyl ester carboxylesterase
LPKPIRFSSEDDEAAPCDRIELLDIDDAGHTLLPEQPKKIAEAIIAFARKHRGSR